MKVYTCVDEFGPHTDHSECLHMMAQMVNSRTLLDRASFFQPVTATEHQQECADNWTYVQTDCTCITF